MRAVARVGVLVATVLDIACVCLHCDLIQASRFWHWPWRAGPAWPLLAVMGLSSVPLVIASLRWGRGILPRTALALVSVSLLVTPAVGLVFAYSPTTVLLPAMVVEDRAASSYWSDARRLLKQGLSPTQVLSQYPHWLPQLYVHTRNKPPGFLMCYYALLEALGRNNHGSAIVGAICIALGTAVGVPLVYRTALSLHGDVDAAFWAAVLFALTPMVSAIYPQFDSCFPALVCLTVILWLATLRGRTARTAFILGLVLAGSFLFTSNLLVMGTLLIALAAWESTFGHGPHVWRRFAVASTIIALMVVGFYLLLWCVTGYNHLATMQVVLAIERNFETVVAHRPWPQILPSDFLLFFFGTGHLLPLLAIAGSVGATLTPEVRRRAWAMRICLLQILLVGCTGLLRGETTRCWCFLVPLLTVPAGLELTRWPRPWRLGAVALLGALMFVMVQNVEFNSFAAR